MYALVAIAVFPFLTLLLIGLAKAEAIVTSSAPRAAEPVPADPLINEKSED